MSDRLKNPWVARVIEVTEVPDPQLGVGHGRSLFEEPAVGPVGLVLDDAGNAEGLEPAVAADRAKRLDEDRESPSWV